MIHRIGEYRPDYHLNHEYRSCTPRAKLEERESSNGGTQDKRIGFFSKI
jgi:hypothetical protein